MLGPKTQVSRPVTDRVKESLFSVLYKYDLPGDKRVADLFSGVGSLGLEALSRGARFVTFVERDPKISAILKKNIEKAGFDVVSKVIQADAFMIGAPVVYSERTVANTQYEMVFVDPPYARSQDVGPGSPLGRLLSLLQRQVTDEGFVVVRTDERTDLLDKYGQLQVLERRRWGTMAVTILQKTST